MVLELMHSYTACRDVAVMQAILEAMRGVVNSDVHHVINNLNNMSQSLEDIMISMKLLQSSSTLFFNNRCT